MFLQGTGDVLISYENEAINVERQGKPVEHVNPPQTFKIENPVAVVTTSTAPRAGQRPEELPVHPRGSEAVGRGRLPAGRSRGRRRVRQRLPGAAEAVDDRRPRRLERRRPGAVRQGQRLDHQDLQAGHWMTAALDPIRGIRPELAGDGQAGPPRGSQSRSRQHVAAGRRRDDCGCRSSCCCRSPRSCGSPPSGGWARVLGRRSRRNAALESFRVTLTISIGVALINAGVRAARRLGADARRLPGQAAGRRDHRPAVRAADHRREPGDAGALRARTARSGIHLQHTKWGVGVALLFVTLPFVVRSVQPVLLELDREVEEAAASLGANNCTDLHAR